MGIAPHWSCNSLRNSDVICMRVLLHTAKNPEGVVVHSLLIVDVVCIDGKIYLRKMVCGDIVLGAFNDGPSGEP